MNRIGFIGLGQMGSHMASNLFKKSTNSTQFTIFDTSSSALSKFASLNKDSSSSRIVIAKSPKDLVLQSDLVVTMLPSSPHVRSVYLDGGDESIMAALQQQQQHESDGKRMKVFIDSSTIDPQTSKHVSSTISSDSILCVDAPVSGGVGGAEAGTLTFMVGAKSDKDMTIVKPILENMGKNIVYCGGLGTGQAAKICNNMLLGISMLATSETLNLGIRLGIDPKVLSGIINTSSGRNWSCDTYNPVPGILPNVPSSRGYTGGFAIELMTKDLQLASQAAADTKSFNALGSMVKELFQICCKSDELKGKDFSSIFSFVSKK